MNQYFTGKRGFIVVCIVVVVVIVGVITYNNFRFHLVRVDPGKNDVATTTPYLVFTFNKSLNASSVRPEKNDALYTSYKVDGTSVRFTINTLLTPGKTYVLNFGTVRDESGSTIDIGKYVFIPKNIPFDQLSDEQQKILIEIDGENPITKDSYLYTGFDDLLNRGMSVFQVDAVKQAIFQYIHSKKIHVQQIAISSITITPADFNKAGSTATADFIITLDSKQSYLTHVSYYDIKFVRLTLSQKDKIIYNSGQLST